MAVLLGLGPTTLPRDARPLGDNWKTCASLKTGVVGLTYGWHSRRRPCVAAALLRNPPRGVALDGLHTQWHYRASGLLRPSSWPGGPCALAARHGESFSGSDARGSEPTTPGLS